MSENGQLNDVLIEGADNVAFELYGNKNAPTCRRVYHLLEQGHIPGAFKFGGKWAVWRSSLRNVGRPPSAQTHAE